MNSFTRRNTQYVAQVYVKIHSIIQKESSIELFHEILEEEIHSYLLILWEDSTREFFTRRNFNQARQAPIWICDASLHP